MSYVKTTWVNNETPINGTNLNHIEQGIYDNDQHIGNIENLKLESPNLVGAINNLTAYSSTEHIVGTWIDNKPIYETTFTKSAPTGGFIEFNHNIANVDEIVKIEGQMIGRTHLSVSFNFAGVAGLYGSGTNLLVRADRTKVQYGGGASDWTSTLYIHLYYTKTTD